MTQDQVDGRQESVHDPWQRMREICRVDGQDMTRQGGASDPKQWLSSQRIDWAFMGRGISMQSASQVDSQKKVSARKPKTPTLNRLEKLRVQKRM